MTAGVGANDSNGVWRYGEATPAGPQFSDFLNLAPDSISTLLTGLLRASKRLVYRRTSTQAIATGSGSATAVTLSSTVLNEGAAFTVSAGVATCVVAGDYRVDGFVEYAANATGIRIVEIQTAPAATPTVFTTTRIGMIASAASSIVQTALVWDVVTLAVGDTLRLGTRQTSGGSLNLSAAALDARRL